MASSDDMIISNGSRTLRVLSISGGGMRGLYTSTYLSSLAKEFAKRKKTGALDIGKGFDLIVGTSTGGIIACALVAGLPLDRISDLYFRHGKEIFPLKLPSRFGFGLIRELFCRPKYLAHASTALERVLFDQFRDRTIEQVYHDRQIALAVPTVDMSRHHSWVFKTPHLNGHRDDKFRLVDVCLATSAAPLYRSMARVKNPSDANHHYTFIDGGVWANNPLLVGMIDALQMTKESDRIEIFSLGTCSRPPGSIPDSRKIHRGLIGWKFGGEAIAVSLDAQDFACRKMAQILAKCVKQNCKIVQFPQGDLPAEAMPYLDLDETRDKGMAMLIGQAHADVSLTLSQCDRADNETEKLLASLLNDLPSFDKQEALCDSDLGKPIGQNSTHQGSV